MPLKPIVLQGEQKRVLFLQSTEPIQIKGVAGSGKTTVALYRAKHLIDTQSNLFQEAKVAIFTYNRTLVKYINSIKPYISGGYKENSDEVNPIKPAGINGVNVINFDKWAYHFIETYLPNTTSLYQRTISGENQRNILNIVKSKYSNEKIVINKSIEFFTEEISWIKGKNFLLKDEYFDAKRTGRGTNDRVTLSDKEVIWNIFSDYNTRLVSNNQVDFDDYALLCLKILQNNPNIPKPFTHIIVDEAQDLSKAQILVISQIVSDETKSISIIADAAQRIYKSGFTWGEVGLNVRGGRTIAFKKNYRNTKQIAFAAKSLLDKETDNEDFTEIEPVREGTTKPIVGYFANWAEQCAYLISQLYNLKSVDSLYSTVILHRSHNGLKKIKLFLETNNFIVQELLKTDDIDFESDSIKVCTLSSVKGLEFENVFIIDLNDDVIPYPPGFNDAEDEFHISTERRLLYTSMTRARERLYLLSSGRPTRYLSEIDGELVEIIGDSSLLLNIWWNNLDKVWKSIFQAHVEISNKDGSYYQCIPLGYSNWKHEHDDIFETYKVIVGKEFKFYENSFDLIQILEIRTLNLIKLGLSDLNPISILPKLQSLYCFGNGIKVINPSQFKENLIYLDCSHNNIEDISSIPNYKNLKVLDLSYNKIKNLENITGLSELMMLILSRCGLENVPDLSVMPSLGIIYLDQNPIQLISDSLKNHKTIRLII